MAIVLQTERLILREFTLDDTAFIIELLNSPGWLEFIGDRNIKTESQAQEYLQNGPIRSYGLNGYGLCMVVRNEDSQPIGMCGIIKRDSLEHPDIGFAFLPAFMRQGYAFEIAGATMKFAAGTLKLPAVMAITVPANTSSIQLLEKIGMKFVKIVRFQNDSAELMLYSNE